MNRHRKFACGNGAGMGTMFAGTGWGWDDLLSPCKSLIVLSHWRHVATHVAVSSIRQRSPLHADLSPHMSPV